MPQFDDWHIGKAGRSCFLDGWKRLYSKGLNALLLIEVARIF
jgi:hypothetical protein